MSDDYNKRSFGVDIHTNIFIQENFIDILDSIGEGIYITDGKTNTIFLNKAYEVISGTSREKFLGKDMYQCVKEKLVNTSASIRVVEEKTKITMYQTLNNGKRVLITGMPIFKNNEIILIVTIVRDITKIMELEEELDRQSRTIQDLTQKKLATEDIIYKSHEMKKVVDLSNKVAAYNTTILITGETGVGKDVIANYIHRIGNRKAHPFVDINCSAIPYSLMESELFGYEKESFTGASKEGRKGLFEAANGGTLFLDEIAEMPMDMQVKLLKALQNKSIRRVGGTEDIPVDVKIIAATNKNLLNMVKNGTFREDLYYRLNVIPIHIPALRYRREDILVLANYFLNELNEVYESNKKFSEEYLYYIYNQEWTGNVRELKNNVERAYILNTTAVINPILSDELFNNQNVANMTNGFEAMTLNEAKDYIERFMIERAIKLTNSAKEAAEMLGIDPSTFSRKKQKINL